MVTFPARLDSGCNFNKVVGCILHKSNFIKVIFVRAESFSTNVKKIFVATREDVYQFGKNSGVTSQSF